MISKGIHGESFLKWGYPEIIQVDPFSIETPWWGSLISTPNVPSPASASLAADIDAGGHTALDGLHVLTAQLALLTATAAALLFDAIAWRGGRFFASIPKAMENHPGFTMFNDVS